MVSLESMGYLFYVISSTVQHDCCDSELHGLYESSNTTIFGNRYIWYLVSKFIHSVVTYEKYVLLL